MSKIKNTQPDFMAVVALIKQAQSNALKSVNTELINLYWNVGAYLTKQLANANWGEKTVDELADFIQNNHPNLKGFNRRGLYRMKQFYETYANTSMVALPRQQLKNNENQSNTIVSPLVTQLEINDIKESTLVSQYTLALPSKKLLQQKLHELFENFNENE
jgi:hypothetical protein